MSDDERTESAKQSWGYELVGQILQCLPLAGLIVWIIVDHEFAPVGEILTIVVAASLMTVGLLRTGVTLTADELVIRYPVGSLRLKKEQVASARFNYFGLIIERRDGHPSFAFLTPGLTSTELSGGEPPPSSAAYQITKWAQEDQVRSIHTDGLVLREWCAADIPVMVSLFDTAEIDRWTPLAHPFDRAAAEAYLARALDGRKSGTLQYAITEDGGEALGEVLLFPTEAVGVCELAYAVGAKHRGRQLAARSIKALLPVAVAAGYREARLLIATDNVGSQKVALAAGFTCTDLPTIRRERKGYVLHLTTWTTAISGIPRRGS